MSTGYTITWGPRAWWGGVYVPFQGLEEPELRANTLEASQPPPGRWSGHALWFPDWRKAGRPRPPLPPPPAAAPSPPDDLAVVSSLLRAGKERGIDIVVMKSPISTKKTPRPHDHRSRIPTRAPRLPSPMPSPSARGPHENEPERGSHLPGPPPPE